MSGAMCSALFALGCAALFVGERVLGAGAGRVGFSGAGALMVACSLAWRSVRWARAEGERRRVERAALVLFMLGALGLGLYAVRAAVPALAEDWPRLSVGLAVLWPTLVLASLVPLLLVELSAASMARAPVVEAGRVMAALRAGLGMASVLVTCSSVLYVASTRDAVADFSYFRTARPGESTRKLVRALNEPVEATLFFPPASEVAEQARLYFDALAAESPLIRVGVVDQAVEPRRARALDVLTNGVVVLQRGERRERLQLGTELTQARGGLRALDREVHRRLVALTRARRTVYFTSGHGERTERPSAEDARAGVRGLVELFRAENHDVRTLGAGDGLATDVPEDAAAVVAVGPSRPFLPEERAALQRYFSRGGRLWLALDTDAPEDAGDVLAPLGLKLGVHALANDVVFLRRTLQVSDRANIGTQSFSSHPAVAALARANGRDALVLSEARAVEELRPRPATLQSVEVTVRALPDTFADTDGDFTFDTGVEERRPWPLVVAVQGAPAVKGAPPPRALVLGDADALADVLLPNRGNAYLALDGMRWLVGNEDIAGAVESEEDVPLLHSRAEDRGWFYGSVFLAPALVLGAGVWMTRRRGRSRRTQGRPP
ncbi:MAG: GldG family protein [Myxococcaceae bacterium]|nr:GldG family protein [Myxococcaceae bacterium]MCI0673068.1 GldG family protein [Myxococcaceae bacterium]